jgi:hypothetical protein
MRGKPPAFRIEHLVSRLGFVLAACLLTAPCTAQTGQPNLADYRVYTKHPRLWLDGGRLERLRHDVQRDTDRWRQLQSLNRGGAQFPEEPLWLALQFQVAGSSEAGRKAAEWALAKAKSSEMFSDPTDLRLGAIVFDWCHELLSSQERERLAGPLGKAAQAIAAGHGLEAGTVRSAVLAALAVADEWEQASHTLLELVDGRWRREIQPALVKGETPDRAAELMAMLEIFHAVRYNLEQDLWREADAVFRPLPRVQMLRYYPRPVETDNGFLRELARPSSAKLDVQAESVPARIAEMMLVAYENTLEEYQFLQGWIRHDAYVLRDPYGAVYEFIWINPYLPGLSYSNSPPVAHDEVRGRVFGRQGWNEDDVWAGYLDGELQVYGEGQLMVIGPATKQAPLEFAGAAIVPARLPMKFEVEVPRAVGVRDERVIYVVGLREEETCSVKVNGSRFRPYTAGRGGIIIIRNQAGQDIPEIDFDQKVRVEIRGKK